MDSISKIVKICFHMDSIFPHIQTKTNSKTSEIHLLQIVAQLPNVNEAINIQRIVYEKLILPQVVKKLYFKKPGGLLTALHHLSLALGFYFFKIHFNIILPRTLNNGYKGRTAWHSKEESSAQYNEEASHNTLKFLTLNISQHSLRD
jgi:hypothetical protein